MNPTPASVNQSVSGSVIYRECVISNICIECFKNLIMVVKWMCKLFWIIIH